MKIRSNGRKRLILGFIALLLVSLACVCTGSSTISEEAGQDVVEQEDIETPDDSVQEESTPASTNTPIPTDTPLPPTATPNPGLVKAGTHLVGDDIQPGIYQGYAGDDLLSSCYWERLSDLSGSFDAILANDNAVGQFYIEVQESDQALSVDCEIVALEYLPEADGEFLKTLAPGTYIVGRDIQPGLYRGEAGSDILDSCYWERLRDVSGNFSALIANDNATGQFFVQISESDFAFSVGCEVSLVEE